MLEGIGIATTCFGKVSGAVHNGITVFQGIPYAAPPVGALRWKAPQDPAEWAGVRPCNTFSDIAWQPPGFVGSNALEINRQNEDCLYLNVWTPAQSPYDRLPVLFWIHGGAFQGGVGHEELFHGWHLAGKGVVVVSINYRLGAMGFLAHPELSREDPNGVSGNYGLLDMIQALKWVKKNIAAFGGDPNRITVDGQSAGGMAVCCLLASPLANGLISGAIIQSGGPSLRRHVSLEQCEKAGVALQEALGCKNLRELRSVSPEKLIGVHLPASFGTMPFQPNLDGHLLTVEPGAAFLTGRISSMPVLFGSNSDEGLFGPGSASHAEYVQVIKEYAGDDYKEFSSLYSMEEKDFETTMLLAGRDFSFAGLRLFARHMETSHPCPVFHYYFCQPTVADDGRLIGATHSSELFYMFHSLHCIGVGTVDGKAWKPLISHEDQSLSDAMTTYWTSFVKLGDPNTVGLPAWPAYAGKGELHMRFKAGEMQAETTRYPQRIEMQTRLIERRMNVFLQSK